MNADIPLAFCFLFSPGPQMPGFRLSLPTLSQISLETPHRHFCEFVSWIIINLCRLTTWTVTWGFTYLGYSECFYLQCFVLFFSVLVIYIYLLGPFGLWCYLTPMFLYLVFAWANIICYKLGIEITHYHNILIKLSFKI